MKKLLITAAVAATAFTAVPAFAQGIGVDTPVGGVRIGEPYHHRYYHEGPTYERRVYRDREVGLRGCRSITIHRDGMTKHIRKCGD